MREQHFTSQSAVVWTTVVETVIPSNNLVTWRHAKAISVSKATNENFQTRRRLDKCIQGFKILITELRFFAQCFAWSLKQIYFLSESDYHLFSVLPASCSLPRCHNYLGLVWEHLWAPRVWNGIQKTKLAKRCQPREIGMLYDYCQCNLMYKNSIQVANSFVYTQTLTNTRALLSS